MSKIETEFITSVFNHALHCWWNIVGLDPETLKSLTTVILQLLK